MPARLDNNARKKSNPVTKRGHGNRVARHHLIAAITMSSLEALFSPQDSTGTAPGVHQFKVGMKFEAIDPFNPSHICVVTVIKVLRFNYFVLGVDSLATYFVCHANSTNIFPCGWAQSYNLQLHPPRGII